MAWSFVQDALKEGRVECNLKKTKWAQRMLSLNEAWLVCHEVTAVNAMDLNDGVVRQSTAAASPHHCHPI